MAEDMAPERFLVSKIGYHLSFENSLCGMAMTQGHERKVVNIGLAMKQRIVEPKGVSVATYRESLAHKVCHTLPHFPSACSTASAGSL